MSGGKITQEHRLGRTCDITGSPNHVKRQRIRNGHGWEYFQVRLVMALQGYKSIWLQGTRCMGTSYIGIRSYYLGQ